MGKACLDIVSCGRTPDELDGDEHSESRSLSKKWRWSFRKRSTHDHESTPTVISAPLPLKEYTDDDMNNSIKTESPSNYDIISSPKTTNNDAPSLAELVEREYASEIESGAHESAATVIQASARRFLACKELRKIKSMVKLQAAVRGHLVRREAAGTLRCVEAIVKMQALVRGRLLQQSLEAPPNQENKESSYSSEKMLKNAFVELLLESSPNAKPIHIACDNSSSDSAWKWLERWMILATPDVVEETSNGSGKKSSDLEPAEKPEENPAQIDKISPIEPVGPIGGRKICNPSFVAAQAKFEELSLGNSQRSVNSPSQEPPIKSTHIVRSECGTEISVTSTLDSPDRSEADEIVLELNHHPPAELGEEPSKEDSVSVMRNEPEESEPGLNRTLSSNSVSSKNSKVGRNALTKKSLPSYMQATESARAKVNAANSAKLSPDGQEREVNGRRRLSDSSPSASAERRWQR